MALWGRLIGFGKCYWVSLTSRQQGAEQQPHIYQIYDLFPPAQTFGLLQSDSETRGLLGGDSHTTRQPHPAKNLAAHLKRHSKQKGQNSTKRGLSLLRCRPQVAKLCGAFPTVERQCPGSSKPQVHGATLSWRCKRSSN